jgi:hypothetical protein
LVTTPGKLFLPGATVLPMVVQFEELQIRLEDLALCGHCFAPRFIEDKFNTFILKNKLIAKSVEGFFVQPQKSSLEQLKIMVLTK